MLPTPFALFVVIAAWRTNGESILRTYMLCCLFGATAVFTIPQLGNAPINPAVAMVPALVWHAFRNRRPEEVLAHFSVTGAGFWLLLLLVWGIVSAVLLPRFFAGDTYVFTTSRGQDLLGVNRIPLGPNSTNITQSAYLLLGTIVFFSVSLLLESQRRFEQFLSAMLLLAFGNVLAAGLGLLEFTLGFAGPTSWIKNASYTIFSTYEILGIPRITGTFPEASSFASFTLMLFAYVTVLWRQDYRPTVTGFLSLSLLVLLLLSTSTTAYVALSLYLSVLLASEVMRWISPTGSLSLGLGYVSLGIAIAAASVVVLLRPEVFQQAWGFLETTVLRKLESSSGVERSSWNAQAWTNILETYGIGAGLGSVRASSFAFVLVSNLGLIGVVLFGVFIARIFTAKVNLGNANAAIAVIAARHAIAASLIAAVVSAGVFDLGLAFYALAALAAASSKCGIEGTRIA